MGMFKSKYIENDISEFTNKKNKLANKILGYSISDQLKDLFFEPKNIGSDGYVRYMDGLYIKNLTTEELEKEKVSIFKIKATKNIEVALHNHKTQSQTLFVSEGKIISLEDGISFTKGQSFFVQRNKNHSVKYLKNTIVTVVYLPNLEKL